jgi:hypothetical protein
MRAAGAELASTLDQVVRCGSCAGWGKAGAAGSEVANIKMGAFYKSRSADVGGAARQA